MKETYTYSIKRDGVTVKVVLPLEDLEGFPLPDRAEKKLYNVLRILGLGMKRRALHFQPVPPVPPCPAPMAINVVQLSGVGDQFVCSLDLED